jgi:predicted transcriptional regulator
MPLQNKIKFNADTVLAFRLRQIALREGRTLSEVARRAVEKGIEGIPTTVADGGMVQIERGINKRRPRITAAYLSNTLARAVHQLAEDQHRSTSWVMRDLIRSGLRARGLLGAAPPPDEIDTTPSETVPTPAQT